MRITFLNQAFYPDHVATAQHAHDLARHLVNKGHQVTVIASRSIYGDKGATLAKHEVVDGIEVHRVGASLFGKASIFARIIDFALFYVLAFFKALTLKRPDVIVPFTTPPFIALVGWMMKVVKRCKYVYWVMDFYPDLPIEFGVIKRGSFTAKLFEKINRFCLSHADRTVVLGRCSMELAISKGIPREKLVLIGPWADSEELSQADTEPNPLRSEWGLDDKFIVMYSGNLGLAHDVDTLSTAIQKLKDNDTIRFIFVGGGKRLELMKKFVEEHSLSNVLFKPYQPREQLGLSLGLADLHLISLCENMNGILVPSKLYGIMAAGQASVFIGSPQSQISLVLTESGGGVTVREGDVDELVKQITTLSADPQRCKEMGRLARQAMKDTYDRRHACEAWEKMLLDCVDGSKPDPQAATPTASATTPAQGDRP